MLVLPPSINPRLVSVPVAVRLVVPALISPLAVLSMLPADTVSVFPAFSPDWLVSVPLVFTVALPLACSSPVLVKSPARFRLRSPCDRMRPSPDRPALSTPSDLPAMSVPPVLVTLCVLLPGLRSCTCTLWAEEIRPWALLSAPEPVSVSALSARMAPPWLLIWSAVSATFWPSSPWLAPWVPVLITDPARTSSVAPERIRLPLLSTAPEPASAVTLPIPWMVPPRLSRPVLVSAIAFAPLIWPPCALVICAAVALRSPFAPMKPALLSRLPLCSVTLSCPRMPPVVPECVLSSVWPWVSIVSAPAACSMPASLVSWPLCTSSRPRAATVPRVLSKACARLSSRTSWPATTPSVLAMPLPLRVSACAASTRPPALLTPPWLATTAVLPCTEPMRPPALATDAALTDTSRLAASTPCVLSTAPLACTCSASPAVSVPPAFDSEAAAIVAAPPAPILPWALLSIWPVAAMARPDAPAACSVPPWLTRRPAAMARSPLPASVPPVLSSSVVARTDAAPLPVCTSWPDRLDSTAVSTCRRSAVVCAPSSVAVCARSASVPLLAIVPRAPSRVVAVMASAPVPACSMRPSTLVSVAAPSVRSEPFVARRPPVLSKRSVAWTDAAPVPVCNSWPERFDSVAASIVRLPAVVCPPSSVTDWAFSVSAPLPEIVPRAPSTVVPVMASVPVPACATRPSVLTSVGASSVRFGPLAVMRPPVLSSDALAWIDAPPMPVWLIWPLRFDSVPARICSVSAEVCPPSSVADCAVSCSAPLVPMTPRAPLRVPTFIASVPVPACSMRPPVLTSVCAPSDRLALLVAMRPPVLSNWPGSWIDRSDAPVWTSWPCALERSCAVSASRSADAFAPSVRSVPAAFAVQACDAESVARLASRSPPLAVSVMLRAAVRLSARLIDAAPAVRSAPAKFWPWAWSCPVADSCSAPLPLTVPSLSRPAPSTEPAWLSIVLAAPVAASVVLPCAAITPVLTTLPRVASCVSPCA
ncbi:hypothetical protein GO290_03660 [Ralstonia solanacearum]|nr:hypothetical protein [Ralstonia solanacearum]